MSEITQEGKPSSAAEVEPQGPLPAPGLTLERIVAEYPDAIIRLDLDGHIQLWNRGAQLTFGYTADEAVGQSIEILLPRKKKYANELAVIRRELERRGYVRARETVRRTKDGREVHVLLTETTLRDAQGQAFGSFVILKDIDDRKRLERRLIQSERLSVIGKMASHLAHEIKNPLNSILLNAEMLGDEIDDLAKAAQADSSEARGLLDVILREVRQLRKVTELYLDFARSPKDTTRRVSINRLLRQIIRFLRNDCAERNIRIDKSLSREVPALSVDPIKLKQAFLNVIRNGIDAIGSDGVLAIRSRLDESQVRITVADDGKGMSPEELDQLFTPFFTTKSSGTGLGVAYAQQVVLEHNGEIHCESEPGQGTTFVITLPAPER
ncbi:MAG: two-component system sensor histidine kinase NtrB, partial [Candidatus Brocadiia bacterium]